MYLHKSIAPIIASLVMTGLTGQAQAQQEPTNPHAGHQMRGMQGHEMPGMQGHEMPMNPAETLLMNVASGTGLNARSWPMPMLMHRAGSWKLMFMGQAFLVATQQSGPRGDDKI